MADTMKVVILAGGYGTRLQEETVLKPKPMIEIGGRPILWHIMKIYAAFACTEFIVALGYKGEYIKKYFLDYYHLDHDISIHTRDGRIETRGGKREDWTAHLVDTGIDTLTGGRLKRLKDWIGGGTFMMTYGDGVADIDINALLAHHRRCGKLATVTAVRPESRFGGLTLEGDLVSHFVEKPQISEGWISGGFFVLEPKVLDYIGDENILFERGPLEKLASERQLAAYRHDGFWQPMDTLRDVALLNDLWAKGKAPWKLWKE